ncbi:MAG: glycerophosphodiester phosphodiesterase [Marinosulfonomonas sp.]|nr:MAG: glycerophosphodiester phosphodiesterase [Marinosulfonomonas sp.]
MSGRDRLSALRAQPGVIRLHGHRGARGVMPENTMAGFRHALECGVNAVEFDVQSARDGVPVVTHNPHLMPDMTRDSAGQWLDVKTPPVNSMSLAQIQSYDMGGLQEGTAYGALYPDQAFMTGQRVPTLAQLADLMANPVHADVWLNLEIKSNPLHPEYTPPIPALVSSVLKVVQAHDLLKRCIIQSFDWRILREVALQAPDSVRSYLSVLPATTTPANENIYDGSPWMDGYVLADFDGSLPHLVAAAGGQVWSPYFADLNKADLAEARALGLIVNVWTVNTTQDMDAMIALGVDGIITDYPGRAQRRLLAHGMHWRDR